MMGVEKPNTPGGVQAAVGMMLTHATACAAIGFAKWDTWHDAAFFLGLAFAVASLGINLRKRDATAWWFCRLFGYTGGAIMGLGALVIGVSIATGVGPFRDPFLHAPVLLGGLLALWITLAVIAPLAVAWSLSTERVRHWFHAADVAAASSPRAASAAGR